MKKIIYTAVLASVLFANYGCKKFLNEKPLSQVPIDKYFKSVKDITAAMTGVYTSFQQEMTGGGTDKTWGKYHYWGEGRTDNFDRSQYSTSNTVEMSLNELTSNNGAANWSGLFRTIGRANNCIKYIPLVPDYDPNATPAIINNNMAQAYALRAMSYFYIVRLWGDAPIWTEPYTDINQPPARKRESKDKIFDEIIIPDLTRAYNLVPKTGSHPGVWYISEGAICAIMADVYMWRKDYPNALIWFTNLFKAKNPSGKVYRGLDATDLAAAVDWKKIFTTAATTENIWSIHWDFTVNGCACLPVSIFHNNSPMKIDSTVFKDWPAVTADLRAKQTIDVASSSLQDRLYKYYPAPSSGNPAWNDDTKKVPVYLVMYRLTDMYLLYAEALNKTSNGTDALRYLNYIRVRAGLAAYNSADPAVNTPEALERAIISERRWELYGEGKRWFDLVRTNKVNEALDPTLKLRQIRQGYPPTGFGSNADKLLWPIFRSVLEDNKLLVQNNSYN